jgi:hypothetical protein
MTADWGAKDKYNDYPYKIEIFPMGGLKDSWARQGWCADNVGEREEAWDFYSERYDQQVYVFARQKDAVNFALIWV